MIFFVIVSLPYKEGLDTKKLSKSIEEKNTNLNIISERVWLNRKKFYILVDNINRKINSSSVSRKDISSDVDELIKLRENIVQQVSGISGAEHIKHTLDQEVNTILSHIQRQNNILENKKVNLYGGWDNNKEIYVQGVINESNLYDAANKSKVLSTSSQITIGYLLLPLLFLTSGALIFIILKILSK